MITKKMKNSFELMRIIIGSIVLNAMNIEYNATLND